MTSTASDPKIVEKFDQVRKVSGRMAPNRAMKAIQTKTSPNRSN